MEILFYLFLLALLALIGAAAFFIGRAYLNGESPTAAFFGPRPEKRLAVVEHASVDGRRRLVLIRRDDVEHLIMTGGPVDVVIETGIGDEMRDHATAGQQAAQPVFSRQPRTFGQREPAAVERIVPERAAE